jgi:hypothetical protein
LRLEAWGAPDAGLGIDFFAGHFFYPELAGISRTFFTTERTVARATRLRTGRRLRTNLNFTESPYAPSHEVTEPVALATKLSHEAAARGNSEFGAASVSRESCGGRSILYGYSLVHRSAAAPGAEE